MSPETRMELETQCAFAERTDHRVEVSTETLRDLLTIHDAAVSLGKALDVDEDKAFWHAVHELRRSVGQ